MNQSSEPSKMRLLFATVLVAVAYYVNIYRNDSFVTAYLTPYLTPYLQIVDYSASSFNGFASIRGSIGVSLKLLSSASALTLLLCGCCCVSPMATKFAR